MNVHFDLFLQRPFPRMLGAFSSVASVLPLSLGVQGKHSLATWLSSVGSHWIGLWFWVQEVALPSEDSIQLSGAPASLRCCLCPSRLQALPWLPSPLLLTLLLYPYSLNTSRLSWRLRSKTCRGKWSGRTAMTEG